MNGSIRALHGFSVGALILRRVLGSLTLHYSTTDVPVHSWTAEPYSGTSQRNSNTEYSDPYITATVLYGGIYRV